MAKATDPAKHDSGKTNSSATSDYAGRHRDRPVLEVRPPAEQARIIREIREGKR